MALQVRSGVFRMQIARKIIAVQDAGGRNTLLRLKECYDARLSSITERTRIALRTKSGLPEVMKEHRELVLYVLRTILQNARVPDMFEVLMSGSFVKGTNLLDSDLDLTFVYPAEERKSGYRSEVKVLKRLGHIFGNNDVLHIHSPITETAGCSAWRDLRLREFDQKDFIRKYSLKLRDRFHEKMYLLVNITDTPNFSLLEFGHDQIKLRELVRAVQRDYPGGVRQEMSLLGMLNQVLNSKDAGALWSFACKTGACSSDVEREDFGRYFSFGFQGPTQERLLFVRRMIEKAYPGLAPRYSVKHRYHMLGKVLLFKWKQDIMTEHILPFLGDTVLGLSRGKEKWYDRSKQGIETFFKENAESRQWLLEGEVLHSAGMKNDISSTIAQVLETEKEYLANGGIHKDLNYLYEQVKRSQEAFLPHFIKKDVVTVADLNMMLEKLGHKMAFNIIYTLKGILLHTHNKKVRSLKLFDMLQERAIRSYIGKRSCDRLWSIVSEYLYLISALHFGIKDIHSTAVKKEKIALDDAFMKYVGEAFNYSFKDMQGFKEQVTAMTTSLNDLLKDIIKDITHKEAVDLYDISFFRPKSVRIVQES